MSERCLVTGGAGFIGSNLVLELLSRGFAVRVIDDLSTGRRGNLDGVAGDVELVEGDVRDRETVNRVVAGCARVFHQAAIPSVQRSVEDPARSHDVNATGTLSVLLGARDADARVVYASSSSVYGDAAVLPVPESLAPRPISPYGASKLAGEMYCSAIHGAFGLPVVALRYFNVFGPRQDPGSEYSAVVPRFVTRTLRGEPVTIYGDGEQSRDFTFVGDVVAANLLASDAGPEAWGRAFNVAYQGRHTVNELLAAVRARVPGEHPQPVHEPSRRGEVRHSQADTALAREVLGFEPAFTFEEGIRETVAWFAAISPERA